MREPAINPPDFQTQMQVAAVVVRYHDTFLCLLRAPHVSNGATWCLPGGKVEPGEELVHAAARELQEETSLRIPGSQLIFLKEYNLRYPKYDIKYHIYTTQLREPQSICLEEAHTKHGFFTLKQALELPLTLHLKDVFTDLFSQGF